MKLIIQIIFKELKAMNHAMWASYSVCTTLLFVHVCVCGCGYRYVVYRLPSLGSVVLGTTAFMISAPRSLCQYGVCLCILPCLIRVLCLCYRLFTQPACLVAAASYTPEDGFDSIF